MKRRSLNNRLHLKLDQLGKTVNMGRFSLQCGAHVKVLCNFGTYSHWGRHLSNGVVLQRNENGIELHTLHSAEFITTYWTSPCLYATRDEYCIHDLRHDIMQYIISPQGYNLFAKNCEHFAKGSSFQVVNGVSHGVAMTAQMASFIAEAAAYERAWFFQRWFMTKPTCAAFATPVALTYAALSVGKHYYDGFTWIRMTGFNYSEQEMKDEKQVIEEFIASKMMDIFGDGENLDNTRYYEILGVERTASPQQIKNAWREKTKELHPDAHPYETEKYEKLYQQVQEAYEVLRNADKRLMYDLLGKVGVQFYYEMKQSEKDTNHTDDSE